MPPPTDTQARLLRQILLSGMGDQIARKIDEDDIREGEDPKELIRKVPYYRSACNDEPIRLASSSVLRRSNPQFITYQEAYVSSESGRTLVRGITVIEPEWLPVYVGNLCRLSEPLMEPGPEYEETSGKVFCSVTGSFGEQNLPLPSVRIRFPESVNAYKWFGKFLLDGIVVEGLKEYVPHLLSPPGTVLRSWAKLQPRTECLVKALVSNGVRSKAELVEVWKINPTCKFFYG